MIVFDPTTWTISLPPGESPIARQFDNLTRSIVISGVPDGWVWTLLVQASGKLDIIDLEPVEGGVGVTLTAQQLSLAGFYTIQLRGTQGDLVRHTNVLQVLVPKSLSGSATWPTVPSAVEQVLQQMEELNQHPPYPGDDGYWMVWDLDTHAYVESQLPLPPVAEGPAGKAATITVGDTITGQPGTPASVVNTGTESAAVLNFTIPQGQKGNPGAAATVAVGETVTGDPGTEASVENVGTSSVAVLRFTIPKGQTGATPAISVEVSALPAGSEPTVSVSGTPEAPVIYLGIPAGKQGDPGDPGQTPNIEIGTVETLPAGNDVTASISGQTPNLVLNLGIPQGQKGDPGQAATVTVGKTTTGAPGSQASVVNSGTPNAAVLDFTIPSGQTGTVLPPTNTAHKGDVPTWNGENVVWGTPAGGSDRAWKTIIDETSPEGGVFGFSADNLSDITEFFVYTYFPQVESKVPFCVGVNRTRILQDNDPPMSTARGQHSVYHFIFDGESWVSFRGVGINGSAVTYFSSNFVTRWPQKTDGPATNISVTCNLSQQVFPAGAKIKVKGR